MHIHLTGLRTDVEPISYRVDDYAQGGVWANPCDPVSNWMLYIKNVPGGEADPYFKPFRDAPAGTDYMIKVQYTDGQTQTVSVRSSRVKPYGRSDGLFRIS